MTAILIQAIMGKASDQCQSKWGRRRPFILVGSFLSMAAIAMIGLITQFEGTTGYWFLFGLMLVVNIATNTAQAAQQGLIPDHVHQNNRGKYAAVKTIFEIPLPAIIVGMFIARWLSRESLWPALLLVILIVFVTMLLTMLVKENQNTIEKSNKDNFSHLFLMTSMFTLTILCSGAIVNLRSSSFSRFLKPELAVAVTIITGILAIAITTIFGICMSVKIGLGESSRKNKQFLFWLIHRLAFLIGVTNLASFSVFFLQGRLSLSAIAAIQPAANLSMVVGLTIFITLIPAGWLADRFGRKPLLYLSSLFASLGVVLVISAPWLSTIYVGAGLIGIATALFYTASWAIGTDLVPQSDSGEFLGISNLSAAGAGAIGAYVGGPIADAINILLPSVPAAGFVVLFGIYGLLFLLAAFLVPFLSEPSHLNQSII